MFRLNPGPVAGGKESFQPTVPESDDRHTLKCNPCRYGLQLSQKPDYALSGWRHRIPLKRAKSLSVVTSSHACSIASAAR